MNGAQQATPNRPGRRWLRASRRAVCLTVVAAGFYCHRAGATTVESNPEADNWVNSCNSGSGVNNGDGLELRVRAATLWGDIKNFRSLLRFDLADLPADSRRITRAVLNIYYYKYHWDNPAGRVYSIYRVTSAWDELESDWLARDDHDTGSPVYWDSYLAGIPSWDPGGGDFDPQAYAFAEVPDIGPGEPFAPAWMTWEVTELVQEWVDGEHPNEGLLVKDADELEEYVEDIAWGPAQFRSVDYWDDTVWPQLEVIVIGDFNGDGEVDLDDYAGFAECMFGPEVTPDPAEGCLGAFDTEPDGDVDLRDFAALQRVLGS